MPKIVGNTVGVPNPKSDWNQTDATKADYIMNKPDLDIYATKKELEAIKVNGGGDVDLSNYLQKKEGYGLASINICQENVVLPGGTQSVKEYEAIFVDSELGGGEVIIPAYTSDLQNDSGFVKSSDLKDEIEKIFPNGDEVGY